jgi:hypothetical protein
MRRWLTAIGVALTAHGLLIESDEPHVPHEMFTEVHQRTAMMWTCEGFLRM